MKTIFMNTSIALRTTSICRLTLLAVVISALLACSGGDSEDSGSVSFSTVALQRQLGYVEDPETSALVAPANSPSTTVARSIAIGAIVIRSRSFAQGPYSEFVPITELETQLEDDVLDSVNLIRLFNLPAADSDVRLEIPPAGAKKWQLIAAAFSTQPPTIESITEPPHEDALIYIGYGTNSNGKAVFFKTGNNGEVFELNSAGNPVGAPLTSINLIMKRACLNNTANPPKGCAQFLTGVMDFPVISAAVEVTSVEVTGKFVLPVTGAYPFVVRVAPNPIANEVDAATASANIGRLFDPVSAGGPDLFVEIFTTHQLAPGQSMLCQAAVGVAALTTECSEESYFTPGQ